MSGHIWEIFYTIPKLKLIWEYSYFILILISQVPPTPSSPQSKSNNPKREEGPNPLQSGALYPRPTKNSTSKKKKLATQCVAN